MLLLAGALSALISREHLRLRALLLALLSIAALNLVLEMNSPAMMLLMGSALWVWAGTFAARDVAKKRPFTAFLAVFAPLAAIWAFGKTTAPQGGEWTGPLAAAGFSYLMIKAWTYIKDVSDGLEKDPDAAILFAYLFHFPTFLSGPMHTYREFNETLRNPDSLDGETVVNAVFRILLGLVKINILAKLLLPLSLIPLTGADTISPTQLIIGCFTYSLGPLLRLFGLLRCRDFGFSTHRSARPGEFQQSLRSPEHSRFLAEMAYHF